MSKMNAEFSKGNWGVLTIFDIVGISQSGAMTWLMGFCCFGGSNLLTDGSHVWFPVIS